MVLIGAGAFAIVSSTWMFFTMSRLSRAAMALTIAAIGSGGFVGVDLVGVRLDVFDNLGVNRVDRVER